ncbi:MAG: CAP domain-containing protein [Chlorobi bacterium]|nr:CAP domain-containing protein [Chlorobiota bacterium]
MILNLKQKYFFIIGILLFQISLRAQNVSKAYEINKQIFFSTITVDASRFYPELLKAIVFDKINIQRTKHGLELFHSSELLDSIAENQSKYMSVTGYISTKQKGKYSTTIKRAILYGASKHIIENVFSFSLSDRSRGVMSYEKLADDIVFKFYNSVKIARLLDNPEYNFTGFGFSPDKNGKKVYVSLILGNYSSFNNETGNINNLPVKVTTKRFGLKEFDARACRRCNSINAIEDWQKGLFVDDKMIYYENNNLKNFKKIIKGKNDAIAVDVVLKDQYRCNELNLIDYNLPNKGILLKKVNAKKLYKNNLIPDRKMNSLKVEVGKLPENIGENYELNLVLIKNKHICRNLAQSFIITGDANYYNPIKLVADTITLYSEEVFKPLADTAFLTFKIPFEKRKFVYKPTDIEPLLKLLNEPDFIINELTIYAYSSIEGTDKENVMLQQKRAESIVNAIKNRQKDSIVAKIITDYNWQDFKNDVQNTEFSNLASMNMEEAREYIRNNSLQKKLEPILMNHRYAQVDMKVTYDISAEKEEKYVINKFNKAIDAQDLPQALSIQKYIIKKVLSAKYTLDAVYEQKIPFKKEFAGLLMNQLWLRKYVEKKDVETYLYEIDELHKLDPENEYISFNYLYCQILFGAVIDDRNINNIQFQIDKLYYSTFTKKTVDALNMKFQFKIIDSINVFKNSDKMFEESLKRIKGIYEIQKHSEQNALKLTYLFIENKDYEYATKLIDPFVQGSIVSEDLLFTYLSLCSHSTYLMNTEKFVNALKTAKKLYPDKFCSLFKGDKFSFQIFENPEVKQLVCETCSNK